MYSFGFLNMWSNHQKYFLIFSSNAEFVRFSENEASRDGQEEHANYENNNSAKSPNSLIRDFLYIIMTGYGVKIKAR